jgi:cytochrome c
MLLQAAVVVSLVVLLVGCSSFKKLKSSSSNDKIDMTETDTLAALEIIKGSDCITCHKFREKLIGPSFVEVANKYEFNLTIINKLSDKILKGGKGSWGDLPMLPHPSMSKEDAIIVTKYILLLKK